MQASITNLRNSVNHNTVNALSKIYVWSICLEPLLFFLIKNPFIGPTANISRYLQTIVLVGLAIRFLIMSNLYGMPHPLNIKYRKHVYFIIFALASGLYGAISGAYTVPSLNITDSLKISVIRPLTEYLIALYYFLYFVIFPGYFLKTSAAINYFFKIFNLSFYFSLFIGLFDLVLMKIWHGTYDGIPRHLSDMTQVGHRFHGIAGEPRDAFVYLILGIGILSLKDLWRGERKLTKPRIALIFFAALLAQSASGLIGLMLASVLIFTFYIPKIPFRRVIPILTMIIMIIIFSVVSVLSSSRVLNYYYAFLELYPTLKAGKEVTSILQVAMNNIYPVWHRWLEVLDWNFVPVLMGTGFGSSSVVNNINYGWNEVLNPNANVVRTIYDSGVIGTLILIFAFLSPIKMYLAPRKVILKFILLMLLVLGAYFAHRHVAPFLFLGVLLVVFKHKYVNINDYNFRNNSLAYPSKAEERAS